MQKEKQKVFAKKISENAAFSGKILVTGPVKPAVYKLNDIYTQHIYVKSSEYEALVTYKDEFENYVKNCADFNQAMTQYDFN